MIINILAEAARHYFVPYQLAYYVPMEQGRPLLPLNWTPKVITDTTMEQVHFIIIKN